MQQETAAPRVLVAGLGSVSAGDDGFGVEVARRLASAPSAAGVRVMDAGTQSLHLAYELLEGTYDLLILVDAMSRGGVPGTLYVVQPEAALEPRAVSSNGRSARPEHVLGLLRSMGGSVGAVLVVGCEPATLDRAPGLSAPVSAAVPRAAGLVRRLLNTAMAPAALR
jgi:hydrogenase maturation protease